MGGLPANWPWCGCVLIPGQRQQVSNERAEAMPFPQELTLNRREFFITEPKDLVRKMEVLTSNLTIVSNAYNRYMSSKYIQQASTTLELRMKSHQFLEHHRGLVYGDYAKLVKDFEDIAKEVMGHKSCPEPAKQKLRSMIPVATKTVDDLWRHVNKKIVDGYDA